MTPGAHPVAVDTGPARSRRQLPWWLWVLIAAAVVVGLIAALGGFRDVPVEGLPEVELGETFTGNEVSATVTAVYLTAQAPGQSFEAGDGEQFLIVEVTATNNTNTPSLLTRSLVRVLLDGVIRPSDDSNFSGVVDPRTGGQSSFLQPGLETHILFRWDIAQDAAAPGDPIVIGIFERERIYGDPIYGDDSFSTAPVVRILTPIGVEP